MLDGTTELDSIYIYSIIIKKENAQLAPNCLYNFYCEHCMTYIMSGSKKNPKKNLNSGDRGWGYVFVCQREVGGGGSGAYNFVVVILPCGFNLIDLNFPAGRGGGC